MKKPIGIVLTALIALAVENDLISGLAFGNRAPWDLSLRKDAQEFLRNMSTTDFRSAPLHPLVPYTGDPATRPGSIPVFHPPYASREDVASAMRARSQLWEQPGALASMLRGAEREESVIRRREKAERESKKPRRPPKAPDRRQRQRLADEEIRTDLQLGIIDPVEAIDAAIGVRHGRNYNAPPPRLTDQTLNEHAEIQRRAEAMGIQEGECKTTLIRWFRDAGRGDGLLPNKALLMELLRTLKNQNPSKTTEIDDEHRSTSVRLEKRYEGALHQTIYMYGHDAVLAALNGLPLVVTGHAYRRALPPAPAEDPE
ncbi:MAG: hypothetical protein LBJ69_01195 [Holosporales bacterium]|nr:hypothetical protein [Holosporales bacterium]